MSTAWRQWFAEMNFNPVLVKELRSRMRGRRTFIFLTLYLLGLAGLVMTIYFAFNASDQGFTISSVRNAGLGVYYSILIAQVFLAIFVGPALTSGAISGEKEKQTFDLIRTTTLQARYLVFGKLLAALSYILLLVIITIPLQSLIFFLGGVSLAEFLISQLLILSAAVTFTMFGLFSSAFSRSTLMANVITFGGIVLFVFVLPLIMLLIFAIMSGNFMASQSTIWIQEALMTFIVLLLVATNLPATLIASKVILETENSHLLFQQSFDGHAVWFLSPWPLFILISTVLTLILFWASVRQVKKLADG